MDWALSQVLLSCMIQDKIVHIGPVGFRVNVRFSLISAGKNYVYYVPYGLKIVIVVEDVQSSSNIVWYEVCCIIKVLIRILHYPNYIEYRP